MKKIGTIKEIWRYPVKGMSGEQVESCLLDSSGLLGDHLFAVRDAAREEIQSCKFRPELLQCIARYTNANDVMSDTRFSVSFPDGATLYSDSVTLNDKISMLLQYQSTMESLRPSSDLDFYKRFKQNDHTWFEELKATFGRESDEPLPDFPDSQEFKDYVTQLGSFFLVSRFHMITTASINYLKGFVPEADWDMRRFRPNILIETPEGEIGLVEQDWIGKKVIIGGATIHCTEPAPRCGAVTRTQQGLEKDNSMLRSIIKQADQNLGIYGDISGETQVQVGDDVFVV